MIKPFSDHQASDLQNRDSKLFCSEWCQACNSAIRLWSSLVPGLQFCNSSLVVLGARPAILQFVFASAPRILLTANSRVRPMPRFTPLVSERALGVQTGATVSSLGFILDSEPGSRMRGKILGWWL